MKTRNVRLAFLVALAAPVVWGSAIPPANAAPVNLEAVVGPRDQIRLDFADGSKHFVAMMRREGKASGQGVLSGAAVTEYGIHDVTPGVGADPYGYLVFTLPEGDTAYVKWTLRGVFVPGADDKPKLLDNGIWEVVGATGKLKGLQGAGTLHLKPVSQTERKFILDGELISPTDRRNQ